MSTSSPAPSSAPTGSSRAEDADLPPRPDGEAPRAPSSWLRAVGIAVIAAGVVSLVLLAFLWPTATSSVRDIEVDVVANPTAYRTFTERADEAAQKRGSDLPFAFHRVDERADAVQRIRSRSTYGAIVLPASPGDRLEVLTARAASPQVATMLTQSVDMMNRGGTLATLGEAQKAQAAQKSQGSQASQGSQGSQGAKGADPAAQQQMMAQVAMALQGPKVTDVVPLSDDDPQGSGLALAALPLTIGGILGGVMLSNMLAGSWRRLLGVVVYSLVGGIAITALLDGVLGFAPAPTLELWGAITLSLAATVSLIVGLHSALGMPGLGIGALITMLIGNPISSAQAPLQFLPWHWGEIGQLLVPGATATLVRDLSYFPDAPLLHSWLTLGAWVVLGQVLIVVGHHRTGGHAHRGEVTTD